MLFQISNSCNMNCPHCLDSCVPCNEHMSMETFDKAIEFATVKTCAAVALISGGEPTHNPLWEEMLRKAADSFMHAVLVTNGEWLGSEKENALISVLKDCSNVSVQITSVKGLYRLHEETVKKVQTFKMRLRDMNLKQRLSFWTEKLNILALGRAAENVEIMKMSEEHGFTMSCLTPALISAQLPLEDAIGMLERKGKFCKPLVDWKGDIHWSESVLCPHFGSVYDDYSEIREKAFRWRPCGKCADYRKLLAKTDPAYMSAKKVLGIVA